MNSGFARMGDTRRLPLHTVRAARKTLVEDGFFAVAGGVSETCGHLSVSFVLSHLGPVECPKVEEYDRATRSTLAFSGEKGKWGLAAGFEWGAVGGSQHADV
jgi:hypothetical protein